MFYHTGSWHLHLKDLLIDKEMKSLPIVLEDTQQTYT